MRISDWSSDVCSSDRSDTQWLGMLGMHGTYEANWAMNQADLIVCLGARFDDRVTGRLDAFAPNSDRKSGVLGKSASVRVDLGGRRITYKQTTHQIDK